jgi:SpoVK/Ycf46/Vps4 family AAA+-type ATPase
MLCPRQGGRGSTAGLEHVATSCLLEELDRLCHARTHLSFVLGISSRQQAISGALLRPGAFFPSVTLGLPTRKDRAAILRHCCHSLPFQDRERQIEVGHCPLCDFVSHC